MWRNTVRLLFVNVAVFKPVLGALSANDTVCESMELVAALGSALLQKCGGDVAHLAPAVGSSFYLRHTSTWLVFGIGLAR